MYYHSRPLPYVTYGKVAPAPEAAVEPGFLTAYRWLGQHCGFSPQIWLSRSRSAITGFRGYEAFPRDTHVLFGFEHVKGFPVRYETWEYLLGDLTSVKDIAEANARIVDSLEFMTQSVILEDCLEEEPVLQAWHRSQDLDAFLKESLFVEEDQVVVPTLNLKSAKLVVCRNEKQKRTLRRMGFIEDRIQVRRVRPQ